MEEVCVVCGEPVEEIYSVSCIGCGGKIHFSSAESSGDSCGYIVTQWNVCGLAFVCKRCSAAQKPFSDVKTNV